MNDEELSIANTDTAASEDTAIDSAPVEATETPEPAKPEKTPEQREIDRLRRGIDRRTRQLSDARAQLDLTRAEKGVNYSQSADDSEPLSLTRAQIAEMVNAEAHKLAPTLREQAAENERRQSVVQSLAKTWGQERFDAVSSDLDDAFGGLVDRSGRPKPAIEAVFEADEPAKIIEWLADPDNIDEAERISKLSAVQAGKAITQLEIKLAAEAQKAKPKASKSPAPLESIRGGGVGAEPDEAKMTDAQWAKHQEQKRSKR